MQKEWLRANPKNKSSPDAASASTGTSLPACSFDNGQIHLVHGEEFALQASGRREALTLKKIASVPSLIHYHQKFQQQHFKLKRFPRKTYGSRGQLR
jgi:hypothetical protein